MRRKNRTEDNGSKDNETKGAERRRKRNGAAGRICRRLAVTVLLAAALFAGCRSLPASRSVQVEVPDVPGVGAVCSEESHALTREQMYEDYDAYWTEVEENYPLYGVAERINGADYEAIKESYREEIEFAESDLDFYWIIYSCIEAFNGCGHMQLIGPEDYVYMRQIYGQFGRYGGYARMAYLYDVLNNTASGVFYGYSSNREDASRTENPIITPEKEEPEGGLPDPFMPEPEEERSEQEPENEEMPDGAALDILPDASGTQLFLTDLDPGKIAYAKVPSMGSEFIGPDRPYLEEFFQGLAGYEACVIDIRGNGGGDTSYWVNLIVIPNLKKRVSYTTYELIKGEKSLEYQSMDSEVKKVEEFDADAFPNLNREDFARMEYFKSTVNSVGKPPKEPVFQGEFYVLTDSVVYSSAEAFANFCKETGFAMLVGERTGGDGIGVDPMVVVLPNSGICYRHSSSLGLNPDGSSSEEFGTVPDLECAGSEALSTCLNYIRSKR